MTSYSKQLNSQSKEKIPLIVDWDVFVHFEGDANIAILYSNIRYWCEDHKMRQDATHFKDGKYWVWYSRRELSEKFNMWEESKIRRMLKKLIDAKFIVTGNYNKFGPDRTLWYSTDV